MKFKQHIMITLFLVLMLISIKVKAADWSRIADLGGFWSFSVGDDMNWSKHDVDVSKWDRLFVPDNWDNHYNGYNGFGWYRKTFDVRWLPEKGDIVLFLGQIDDVDEVFVNGVKVGQTGQFPPEFSTAWNQERRYLISRELLKSSNNVIAVRVYDTAGPGGILNGTRIGIFYDDDINLLLQDLSGKWKFSIDREKGMLEANFNDSQWKNITVPGRWEDQGFPDYDGVAWYRTTFKMDEKIKSDDLYLVLGKIDDMDKVYFNGEQFARTEYLDQYSRFNKGNAWRLYRVYRLPLSKLKKENVLVLEVLDEQMGGGIYEGPIGIVNKKNAQILLSRNETDFNWSNPLQYFFNLFDF